jgi:hypothetical protein
MQIIKICSTPNYWHLIFKAPFFSKSIKTGPEVAVSVSKNPAQTRSGCIRFNDWNFHQATFAVYSCPIRLRGAGRYI